MQLHLSPRRLSSTLLRPSIVVEMTAANGGNADADVPPVDALDSSTYMAPSAASPTPFARPINLSRRATPSQQRLNRLVDRLSQEHGGLARLRFRRRRRIAARRDSRLKLLIRMPESLNPGTPARLAHRPAACRGARGGTATDNVSEMTTDRLSTNSR